MKRSGLLLVLALGAIVASAQDILTFKDSHVEKVKVLKVTPEGVTYRDFDDPNGPERYENRENLFSLKLENGKYMKMKDSQKMNYTYSDGKLYEEKPDRKYFGQFDLYIQDGWGLGFMLRRKLNNYAAWNLLGASYMSGWNNPREFGVVNVRVMGLRLTTPNLSDNKLFAEVTPGYTFTYLNKYDWFYWRNVAQAHCFGLDFCAGIQISNKVAIGYNLNYMTNSKGSDTTHWGRISFLF